MQSTINIGRSSLQPQNSRQVKGEYISLFGQDFYCIRNYDRMPPFFMSIVSSSDHWMFISSTGGLTAGRSNAESALFPYYTDDKVTESFQTTGPVSVILVTRETEPFLWEPFSIRYANIYQIERNLYKNAFGSQLLFEEINHDLQISYRILWRTSEKYGFAKTSWVSNLSDSPCSINLVDGVQNILPYGCTTALQTTFSNLLNAYKRNELDPESGLGIFSLSSTLTDLAEPSESLKATTVWQVGLDKPCHILSTLQLDGFRQGADLVQETDIRGQRGAYLLNTTFNLEPGTDKRWTIVAEVNQDGSAVANLNRQLIQQPKTLFEDLQQDIKRGNNELRRIVANADGLQSTNDKLSSAHHFSNVLFNTMRGGIFAHDYQVKKPDLLDFVRVRNKPLLDEFSEFFSALPNEIIYDDLIISASHISSSDLLRICYEYLPLTFSRRHGDPSRPWNKFSINLKKADGSQRLEYQGNWRDIFQNWEPLAWSFPEYTEGMICKFLNATSADGYNPYRITRDGIEWESPAPDDPWANIGYWGDHQIIYLVTLLETSRKFHPEQIHSLLNNPIFSHANIPYRIKPYSALLEDPFNTIEFDWTLEAEIEKRVESIGTDGKLRLNSAGRVFHVNMIEKFLTLLLCKVSNFVPDGGIWMNTQRPEWNDANNALVGKGLSVVTTGYLRRFVVFLIQTLNDSKNTEVRLSAELGSLFQRIFEVLQYYNFSLHEVSRLSDTQRREFMNATGEISSEYRTDIYSHGFSGNYLNFEISTILDFAQLTLQYIDKTLTINRRSDNLYHSYNILHFGIGTAAISHLDEMLEGQVSILGSGFLSSTEAVSLLDSLRSSRLYREDQHSYILYPNRNLPGFLTKNLIHPDSIKHSKLVSALVQQNEHGLIFKDDEGNFHFNGSFRNAKDVRNALTRLKSSENLTDLVDAESETILNLFEKQFNHNAFTGRSGTFFAYEGLGSIYWHMVSKLLLAVQDNFLLAVKTNAPEKDIIALKAHYLDIRSGLGFNKSPDVYGAFPTDPYSHTPAEQGAKQPGMTGQVKEEILSRLREMGLYVENGQIIFNPKLVRCAELYSVETKFEYIDVNNEEKTIQIPSGSCAFTFCQVPFVIHTGDDEKIVIHRTNWQIEAEDGSVLDRETSNHIFKRDHQIHHITFIAKICE